MRLPILVACGLILARAPAAAADLTGAWLVGDKSAEIEIGNCGGAFWGVVIWERTPGHDTENPNPSLRGRPTLGIPVLLDLRPVVQQRWDGPQARWRGRIYNALNGRTYEGGITLINPDIVHLEGCVLGGLFCGGEDWTRVTAPAPSQTNANSTARGAAPTGDVCSRVPDLARGTH